MAEVLDRELFEALPHAAGAYRPLGACMVLTSRVDGRPLAALHVRAASETHARAFLAPRAVLQDDAPQRFHGIFNRDHCAFELVLTNLAVEGDVQFDVTHTRTGAPVNAINLVQSLESRIVRSDVSHNHRQLLLEGLTIEIVDEDGKRKVVPTTVAVDEKRDAKQQQGARFTVSVMPDQAVEALRARFQSTAWQCPSVFLLAMPPPQQRPASEAVHYAMPYSPAYSHAPESEMPPARPAWLSSSSSSSQSNPFALHSTIVCRTCRVAGHWTRQCPQSRGLHGHRDRGRAGSPRQERQSWDSDRDRGVTSYSSSPMPQSQRQQRHSDSVDALLDRLRFQPAAMNAELELQSEVLLSSSPLQQRAARSSASPPLLSSSYSSRPVAGFSSPWHGPQTFGSSAALSNTNTNGEPAAVSDADFFESLSGSDDDSSAARPRSNTGSAGDGSGGGVGDFSFGTADAGDAKAPPPPSPSRAFDRFVESSQAASLGHGRKIAVQANEIRDRSFDPQRASKACELTLSIVDDKRLRVVPAPSSRELADDVRSLADTLQRRQYDAFLATHKTFDSPDCVVCLDGAPDCVLYACGHKCSHTACSRALTKCPVCRAAIQAQLAVPTATTPPTPAS